MTMLSEAAQPSTVKRRPRRIRYITAGIAMPRDADGRTLPARKFKSLVKAYAAELGELSEADKARVTQAAAIAMHIERLQRDIVAGGTVDTDAIIRLSSEHRRLLTSLRGKAAKQPSDHLTDFLNAKYGADESEDADG